MWRRLLPVADDRAFVHARTSAAFADPAVRVAELVGKFGANGLVTSICDDDFSPALFTVANEIVAYVNEPCILGRVAKLAGTTRDDCTVTRQRPPARRDPIVRRNGRGGAVLAAGGRHHRHLRRRQMKVTAADAEAAPLDTTVECAMCTPGVSDPTHGCP